MKEKDGFLEIIEKAIIEVKDEILEREEILYKNYGILNLFTLEEDN